MYRCGYCNAVSRPGQVMLRHTLYRMVPYVKAGLIEAKMVRQMRTTISREIPACPLCLGDLRAGDYHSIKMRRGILMQEERERKAQRLAYRKVGLPAAAMEAAERVTAERERKALRQHRKSTRQGKKPLTQTPPPWYSTTQMGEVREMRESGPVDLGDSIISED